jgi:putative mRNA 3-end processing factor
MEAVFTRQGIYLPELDLWLDGTDPSEVTWISHGHADHARGKHDRVIGTKPSLEVFRLRWEGYSDPVFQPVEYGQPFDFRGARLTAYPASHIVGAAQLLIEFRGERLVYTGDIKLRQPMCGQTTLSVAGSSA